MAHRRNWRRVYTTRCIDRLILLYKTMMEMPQKNYRFACEKAHVSKKLSIGSKYASFEALL
jgi:hypothetical protein